MKIKLPEDKGLLPWKKPKPKGKSSVKLTQAEIAEASEHAHKAGRRYPNLVDNMYVAKKRDKAKLPAK